MTNLSKWLLLLSLAFLSACNAAAQEMSVSGTVFEAGTDKPMAGAIVVGRWAGNIPLGIVDSRGVCVHVEIAVTDTAGRYRLGWPSPEALVWNGPLLDAYLAGYQKTFSPLSYVGRPDGSWVVFAKADVNKTLGVYPDERSARAATSPSDLYLKPFVGSVDERIEFLQYRIFSGTGCHDAGENRRNRYPLLRAAYQEAKNIAVTKEQRKQVAGMRDSAKREWLAPPKNSPGSSDLTVPPEIDKDLE